MRVKNSGVRWNTAIFLNVPMNCMKDIFNEDSLGICSAELNIT